MMTQLPKVEGAQLQTDEPDQSLLLGHAPEKHTVIEEGMHATAEEQKRRDVPAAHGGSARCPCGAGFDFIQEGANMMALQMRQSRCLTPLTISSKATQALLRQF